MPKKSSTQQNILNDQEAVLDRIKNEKIAAIRRAFSNIDKKTKRSNTAFFLSDNIYEALPHFSTGILSLDVILNGGLVPGRIIECYGKESSGKTALMLKCIAAAQQQGKICCFSDVEGTFDQNWAQALGIRVDDLILTAPNSAEECFEVLTELINSRAVDFIVVDSISALVTEQEFENDIGKQSIGLLARFLSQELKKINSLCSQTNTTVAFINQIRDTIGNFVGPSTTTTGGRALKFYSSIRLEVNKVFKSDIMEKMGNESLSVGHTIKVKLVKSKISAPGRSSQFVLYFDGRQTDVTDELASIILTNGLIPKYDSTGKLSDSGRTYIFELEDEKLRVTKQADMADALRKCPKIKQHFIDMIKLGNYVSTQVNVDNNTDENNINENDINEDNINNANNYNQLANKAEEIESFDDL